MKDINTDYGSNKLYNASCQNDEDIWICGDGKIIRLYNLRGGGTNKVNTDQVRKLSLRNGIDIDWISSLY